MKRLVPILFLLVLLTGIGVGALGHDPLYAQARGASEASLNNVATFGSGNDLDGVMGKIASLFAWLFGASAVILDSSVYYTIVGMGEIVNSTHGLVSVKSAWTVLRDIGNIVLIFGFLAVGIMTILNTERYGFGTKMIPKLLIAAVFLNFSLFISEAIIDTGNLFATQFYTAINGGVPATPGFGSVKKEGISNKVMSQLGMTTIYGDARNGDLLTTGSPFLTGFMAILLFCIATFVFFSLAFILIARFVILIFLIIIAPIGFVGMAVPKMEKVAKMWWSKLIDQTITAPVLMLMLYVALKVITDVNFLKSFSVSGNAWTDWVTVPNPENVGSFAGILLSFLVAMGLLLMVTILARKLSAFGANQAITLGNKLSGSALAFGAPALVGRNTLGAGSKYLQNWALKSKLASKPVIGRLTTSTLGKVAGASFDIRSSGIVKGVDKTLSKQAGFTVGSGGGKGGFVATEKKAIESRVDYAKSFKDRDLTEEEQKKEREGSDLKTKKEKEHDAAREKLERLKTDPVNNARIEAVKTKVDIRSTKLKEAREKLEQLEAQKVYTQDREGLIKTARIELDEQVSTLKDAQKELEKLEEPIETATAELLKHSTELDRATKDLDAIVKENKKASSAAHEQRKYADRLTPSWVPEVFITESLSESKKKINDYANKTKDQREADVILDALRLATKNKPEPEAESDDKKDASQPT